MKKFFETPEVSSVELNQTDVIMVSNQKNIAEQSSFTVLKDTNAASEEYNFWKNRD